MEECWSVGDRDAKLSTSFGSAGQIAAERALGEFRSARPVIVTSAEGCVIGVPADGLGETGLALFRRLCHPAQPHLVITAPRARVLGIEAAGPVGISISDGVGACGILALVAERRVETNLVVVQAGPAASAAIELAKLAQRLPALVVADGAAITVASCDPPLVIVPDNAVAHLREAVISSTTIASEAHVPLNGGLQARFVIFRDAIGGTSIAVVIGEPDFARPVPVRMHSACLTSDVFESRRCDCGDQLRLTLGRINDQGGGIILYLDQEGRGLGLSNMIRAYHLQDTGLDTHEANAMLGFDDDERDYGIAARMLHMLGCTRVLLLTNNLAKLEGLAQTGIEVSGRLELQVPVNPDNRR
jgi:GTP cyclohydrolase II